MDHLYYPKKKGPLNQIWDDKIGSYQILKKKKLADVGTKMEFQQTN